MSVNECIRIVIVDDHELVRDPLAELLESQQEFEVVASVGDAESAVSAALEHQPDVLLMDIDMPGTLAFDAAGRINTMQPDTRIIFISAFCYDHYIESALKVRARGYVTKSQPTAHVMDAIRAVIAGKVYFSSDVQARLVLGSDGPQLAETDRTRRSTLSPRETEVLMHLAKGMSKKQISGAMHISVKTVDGHTEKIMSKLDIHDRVELALFAVREGLIKI